MHGTAGLDENTVEPDDDGSVFLGQLRGCFEKTIGFVGDRRRDSQGRSSSIVNGQATRLSMTLASHELQVDRRRLEVDHGRGNDAGDTTGREREAKKVSSGSRIRWGFFFFWRYENTEARTMSHLPSA